MGASNSKIAADPGAQQDVESASTDTPQRDPSLEAAKQAPGKQQAPGVTPLTPSLDELNQSVQVPPNDATWHRKLLAFAGIGVTVAIGYMDPGNWAADVAAGSAFGYTLLSVVLFASLFAMFLQFLALKLGAATGLDLAQACHVSLSYWPNILLWLLTEVAIAATDLVGIVGSAMALNLLFGLPVWIGVLISVCDVLILLFVLSRNMRLLELVVAVFALFVAGSLAYELILVKPNWGEVFRGFVPQGEIFKGALYSAVAILGATVMPHNLYLHSSLVQTRGYPRTLEGRTMAVKYASWDSAISLSFAFLVNCAILVLAAAAFHYGASGPQSVADISDAYMLISSAVGQSAARIVLGVALLAAAQNSSIAGTLAGQVVMEGFLELKLQPWIRRLITRMIAIVPAMVVAILSGQKGIGRLLVLSQVVLSVQLPFAVGPLVYFTSSRATMSTFVNSHVTTLVAWLVFALITGLNFYLAAQTVINLA